MAPELRLCQSNCTTPATDFMVGGELAERTGVSTDDHGWTKGGALGTAAGFQAGSGADFSWNLGYFFMRDVLSNGEHVEVVQFRLLVGVDLIDFGARLYNVSGTYKWRFWNKTTDSQIGTDSAAQTVGSTLLVNLRIDVAGDQLDLFVDGSNVKSVSQSIAASSSILGGSGKDAGNRAYWSAWSRYLSGSDDLNEAHYPEMRLLHPDGDGSQTDYTNDDYQGWDDLASEGDPDGDTTYLAGGDGFKIETSTLTTHTMTNTIQGVAELLMLRQDQASKTVVHGGHIRNAVAGTTVSFGSEDIGETYVVREAVFHTPPGGGAWDQADDVDALEVGHTREPGSDSLNIRVTTCALVVVALGTTNLAPPDPPQSFPPVSPLRAMRHLVVR